MAKMNEKQNMSGHITMNAQQAMFFQELNTKAHKLARMREQGLLATKPSRNPLNAERSPRGEFIGFSFDPPPARPQVERWKYPDSDWGLMAKFSSQKGIYDAIYDRERKQKEIEEQVRKIKEENMFRISNELEKQRALFDAKRESQLALEKQYKQYEDALQNPHQHSQYHFRRNGGESEAIVDDNDELGVGSESRKGSRKKAFSADHFVDPNHEKVNRSSVATIASSTKANLLAVEHELAKKKSLMDFKASTIKSLNSSHPEILTKLRCERAVEYVQRMEKKNSRRLSSVATAQPFRPGGSLKPSASTGKVQAASSASCEQASAAVSQPILREELRKTEDMIRLQKLKIGLKRS